MSILISKKALIDAIVNTPTKQGYCNAGYLNGMATRQNEILDIIKSHPTVSGKEIRDKAIERLKDKICSHFADWQYSEDDNWIKDIIELASESVEEIAEKMKEVKV